MLLKLYVVDNVVICSLLLVVCCCCLLRLLGLGLALMDAVSLFVVACSIVGVVCMGCGFVFVSS